MRAAREGAQVPFAAYPAVKFTPSRAIESMCGVGTDPDATPPPPKVRSFHPRSSARINTTFGGRCATERPAGSGPVSHSISRWGPIDDRRSVATSMNSSKRASR
jgi:hypothetical protein